MRDQIVEHEVKLRIHDELFSRADERLKNMESKLNWIITLVIGGIFLPVALHLLGFA